MPRKLVEFHLEDLRAIEQLASDKSSTVQELMDEAVRDLLKKHGLPTNLRDALRQSTKAPPEKSSKKQPKKKSIPDTPPDRSTQSSGRERTKTNRTRR